MSDISRRRTGELLRKLFEILIPHAEGMQAQDALNAVKDQIELTDYEKGAYKDGSPRFIKIIRFATIDATKARWFLKHRGRWSITEEGKEAFRSFPDPEAFYKRAVKLYNQWKRNQRESETVEGADEASSVQEVEKATSITFEQAEEQAWLEIERYLTTMNPYEFQELIAALLRGMGYHVSWVAPPGRDRGIDVIAWTDALGTSGPRVKVQVKRVGGAVGVEGLRAFMAVLAEGDVGIFVSTGGFTKDAEEEARTQEKRKVTLVDLERLFDLWVEYYERLDQSARRRFPLQPIHFLAPLP
jgi:restriction system protein